MNESRKSDITRHSLLLLIIMCGMWYAVCDLHRELSLMLFRPVSVAADDEIFLFFFFFGSKMRQSHIRYPTVQRHSTVRMNRIKIIIIFVVVRIEHYYRIAPLNISRHGMPFCMCFFSSSFFFYSLFLVLYWNGTLLSISNGCVCSNFQSPLIRFTHHYIYSYLTGAHTHIFRAVCMCPHHTLHHTTMNRQIKINIIK